jgi:hypothetical protein
MGSFDLVSGYNAASCFRIHFTVTVPIRPCDFAAIQANFQDLRASTAAATVMRVGIASNGLELAKR